MTTTQAMKASARPKAGKGAARATRRSGRVPGVIYGEKQPPVSISVDAMEITTRIHAGHFMTTVYDLDVDLDGVLLASTSSSVFRVDPVTGSQYLITNDVVQAMAVDPVSGDWVGYVTSNPPGLIRRISGSWGAPPSRLSLTPVVSQPTDMAVDPSMKVYGTPMPSATTYRWQIQPSPRWVPVRGNTTFGLTVTPSPGPAVALMALAFAPADTTMFGVHLLIDPSTIGTTLFLAPTSAVTVPLSIPNNPIYAGMHLFAQVLHLENGIPYSSTGLRLVVL